MTLEKKPYCAFFDVDETLVTIKTMKNFLYIFYKRRQWGFLKYFIYNLKIFIGLRLNLNRNKLNSLYYEQFKNLNSKSLEYFGKIWFRYEKKYNKNLFNKDVIDELKKHKENNAKIIFVSGSFEACLKPIADHLKADSYLCTRLEEKKGSLTGKILWPQTIGKGKQEAIKVFIKKQMKYRLEDCYAYGDHPSDIYMLKMVGHPVVINKDKKLVNDAKNNGWRII